MQHPPEIGGRTAGVWLALLLAGLAATPGALSQESPGPRPPERPWQGGPVFQQDRGGRPGLQRPPARTAQPGRQPVRVAGRPQAGQAGAPRPGQPLQPREHPLMPALRWAESGLQKLMAIQDYTAIMVKRERINGKLREPEYLYVRIRHRPMSVYIRFLKPESLAGQEVIWIEGQNNGKMWAHGTGFKKIFGTVSLDPTGPIAMQGNRYPITEIGILNLTQRLIEIGRNDTKYGECEVKFFEGAKINGRSCTCIQVIHPKPRREFLFHVARIYVDDALNIPVRYEAYDWPRRPGGPPELTEEYTYLDVKLNTGLTDADFDINNPNYQFKRG